MKRISETPVYTRLHELDAWTVNCGTSALFNHLLLLHRLVLRTLLQLVKRTPLRELSILHIHGTINTRYAIIKLTHTNLNLSLISFTCAFFLEYLLNSHSHTYTLVMACKYPAGSEGQSPNQFFFFFFPSLFIKAILQHLVQ